jgi:hypothetical protein
MGFLDKPPKVRICAPSHNASRNVLWILLVKVRLDDITVENPFTVPVVQAGILPDG